MNRASSTGAGSGRTGVVGEGFAGLKGTSSNSGLCSAITVFSKTRLHQSIKWGCERKFVSSYERLEADIFSALQRKPQPGVQEQLHFRFAETVNRLLGVADHKEGAPVSIGPAGAQLPQKLPLLPACILELVNQYVPNLLVKHQLKVGRGGRVKKAQSSQLEGGIIQRLLGAPPGVIDFKHRMQQNNQVPERIGVRHRRVVQREADGPDSVSERFREGCSEWRRPTRSWRIRCRTRFLVQGVF